MAALSATTASPPSNQSRFTTGLLSTSHTANGAACDIAGAHRPRVRFLPAAAANEMLRAASAFHSMLELVEPRNRGPGDLLVIRTPADNPGSFCFGGQASAFARAFEA